MDKQTWKASQNKREKQDTHYSVVEDLSLLRDITMHVVLNKHFFTSENLVEMSN